MEDTYNLIGHALRKVMRVVADQQERELIEVGREEGVTRSSLSFLSHHPYETIKTKKEGWDFQSTFIMKERTEGGRENLES